MNTMMKAGIALILLSLQQQPGQLTILPETKTITQDTVRADEFVNLALKGSMVEVEMGKLAQANSGSEQVKIYGQMLEQDHATMQRQLMAIAREEEIMVPGGLDPESVKHIEQLRLLKGEQFDQRFIPIMISDHQRDIATFRMAAETHLNPKVKQFAIDAVPILEKHLAKARALEQGR